MNADRRTTGRRNSLRDAIMRVHLRPYVFLCNPALHGNSDTTSRMANSVTAWGFKLAGRLPLGSHNRPATLDGEKAGA